MELTTRPPNKPTGLPINHPFATASEDVCSCVQLHLHLYLLPRRCHFPFPSTTRKSHSRSGEAANSTLTSHLQQVPCHNLLQKFRQVTGRKGLTRTKGDRDINETAWMKFLVEILSTTTTFCVRNELLWLASKTKEKLHKKENRLNKYRKRKTNKKLSFYLVCSGI